MKQEKTWILVTSAGPEILHGEQEVRTPNGWVVFPMDSQENAEAYGSAVVRFYNRTLRPTDTARTFQRIVYMGVESQDEALALFLKNVFQQDRVAIFSVFAAKQEDVEGSFDKFIEWAILTLQTSLVEGLKAQRDHFVDLSC